MKKIAVIFIVVLFGFIGLLLIFGKTTIKMKEDSNGEPFSESNFYKEYYNSDDLLLINVWATWCKPCVAEFPVLDKIGNEFKDSNLRMVSVSIDDDTIRLKNFLDKRITIKKRDVTLRNIIFRDSIYRKIKFIDSGNENSVLNFTSKQVPYVVLVKNKKILYRTYGDLDIDTLKGIIKRNTSNNQ
ncbi:MAG: TlpA disulfide reductase family protein [Flavobacteriaceae bacterium]